MYLSDKQLKNITLVLGIVFVVGVLLCMHFGIDLQDYKS